MKLAYLILTHADPAHLQRMIGRLAHEDVDFYVHVDAKADMKQFEPATTVGNVYFIKDRVKVTWGSYSIIEATLKGFEQIIASGNGYGHITLLSGQDYPIKSGSEIQQFLTASPGKIFMQYLSVNEEWQEAIPRITQYHFTNYKFPGKYMAQQIVNAVLPKRKLPHGIIAVGRSQWFTATTDSIAYILQYFKDNPWISRFFKLSWGSDEMVFQTIIYNSPFKKDMVNDNLLYVDWSAGKASPKVLTMDDAYKLMDSDKLFARKFNSETDSKILDYLDQLI